MSDTVIYTDATKTDDTVAPANTTQEPTKIPLTRDDLEQALNAARQQEKSKLYKKVEETQGVNDTLRRQLEERESLIANLNEKLNNISDSSLSEQTKIQRQLQSLEERNKALNSQLERVAEEAAQRIHQSELKAYKSQKLRESGITLTELVVGETFEEIDAAIERTVAREKEIFAKAAKDAETRLRSENKTNAPKPIAPSPQGNASTRMSTSDRSNVAKLKDDEYAKIRAKLLDEAKRSTGLA